tara:strand:- start:70 stop:276 length:207 start_codon:yes stop_codon:yes gene_type:complete
MRETTEQRKKRQAMTFDEALKDDKYFFPECCSKCGLEDGRLYVQVEGMYAGNRYCKLCVIKVLKDDYF